MAAGWQKFHEFVYQQFRDIAFCLNPELAHNLTLWAGKHFPQLATFFGRGVHSQLQLQVGSVKWPFPIGLAAGLDKEAEALNFFGLMPLGAIECGTVTPKPQEGNPRPRLWRYVDEESLRNAMGFNNSGMATIKNNILQFKQKKQSRVHAILGANLGKNKITSRQDAPEDYVQGYNTLAPVVDYIALNVSSPNTPGLRDLQNSDDLDRIFAALAPARQKCPKDLYLKVAPDLSEAQLAQIVETAAKHQLTGIIATNTTIIPTRGNGGCSGKILKAKARSVRHQILQLCKSYNLEVIGVGGVDGLADLWDFWQHGGKVMQLFTSFIFQGPPMLYKIQTQLETLLKMHKLRTLDELRLASKDIKLPDKF
ncbi:MAG: quinone-dependent dihydroorotate dehydrogenase [Bacteriovoracaceae bacterium]|nr:quinone-dependent dihydroorotate dehydrogenase [Bacteriovoracaceae bacterium]